MSTCSTRLLNARPTSRKFKTFGKFIGLLAPTFLSAQIPDSLPTGRQAHSPFPIPHSVFPELVIRDVRFERTGYTFWKADSLPLNAALSLSDRLLWENTLDVRANAPGTLATLSVRGAGPSRTPVFWNGLNLQSPMNGVVDASLLPLWPGDHLEIRYGGQSAAQSSGAMGGSVVVEQGQQKFEEGFSGFMSGAAGSFGRWEGGAGAGFSGKKIASKIRAAWQQADNDFSFQKQGLDGQFYTARQVNNFLKKIDLQQFNQLKVNEKNTLKTAFWFQNAFREIPPATTESPRETWQRDRAHRALATWEHAPNARSLWTTRAAWLDDFLAFHLAGDTDTSRSRQALLSTERSASVGKNLAWRAGGTALRQWAQVDGYSDSTRWFGQTRLAGFAMGEWRQGKSRFSALLRQEWAEAQAAPFTWSVGGQFGLGRVGEGRFHVSRNFNLPTLNDRFWGNLGRPDLRPEKGYSAELGWAWYRERGVQPASTFPRGQNSALPPALPPALPMRRSQFSAELTGFQLILDDWILWQPDSTGLFRPGNLRKVWSRGAEMMGSSSFIVHRLSFLVSGRFQFSRTTNVKVYGGSESMLGKQLPYTPNWSGGLSLRVSRGAFAAAYLQQFTGGRFDNGGQNLKPFQVGNLLASCSFWKRRLSIDFRIENLWNSRYEIIRYRPMPGRGWRLGVMYQIKGSDATQK